MAQNLASSSDHLAEKSSKTGAEEWWIGGQEEGHLPVRGFYKNSNCSSSQLLAKDNLTELSSLPPVLGMCMCWRGGLSKNNIYSNYWSGRREAWGWQTARFLCSHPSPGEWSVPIGRGSVVEKQMAPPSFQCLPRWLPHPHICAMLRVWGPPHGTRGAQALEPGVCCPSSPGCPCKDSILASSKEGTLGDRV